MPWTAKARGSRGELRFADEDAVDRPCSLGFDFLIYFDFLLSLYPIGRKLCRHWWASAHSPPYLRSRSAKRSTAAFSPVVEPRFVEKLTKSRCDHCPEGWSFYKYPGPGFEGLGDNSAESVLRFVPLKKRVLRVPSSFGFCSIPFTFVSPCKDQRWWRVTRILSFMYAHPNRRTVAWLKPPPTRGMRWAL
jgi:hypothetical protein